MSIVIGMHYDYSEIKHWQDVLELGIGVHLQQMVSPDNLLITCFKQMTFK